MLNKDKHRLVMVRILKDIYSDISIASLLGFKGGTVAHLFYDLPRFSVDLDFDLLDDTEENRIIVFRKLHAIILKYGEIKDEQQKNFTIFFVLSYGSGEHQIKVEINTRKTGARYEMKNYLGIPMMVAVKESLFAGKLVALTRRKKFVARDLYDAYYFLQWHWDVDENMLASYGIVSVKKYFSECVSFVDNVSDTVLLAGLGELIDEKEKVFVKERLKSETIFLLRAYLDSMKRKF